MTELDLEAGKTLLSLIRTTEKALDQLNKWLNARGVLHSSGVPNEVEKGLSLSIGESRGEGFRLDLNRSAGNPRLLLLIKAELEEQLSTFKRDFDNL